MGNWVAKNIVIISSERDRNWVRWVAEHTAQSDVTARYTKPSLKKSILLVVFLTFFYKTTRYGQSLPKRQSYVARQTSSLGKGTPPHLDFKFRQCHVLDNPTTSVLILFCFYFYFFPTYFVLHIVHKYLYIIYFLRLLEKKVDVVPSCTT